MVLGGLRIEPNIFISLMVQSVTWKTGLFIQIPDFEDECPT